MKTFVVIAFICLASTPILAQEQTITWNERQPLQWADFSGQVNDSSRFDAESFAEVKYNYKFNGAKTFYFEVFANFNKNTSWCKKEYQSDALLKHEQLHFDIAALYATKLREAFESYPYTQNFKNEILEIFSQKKIEYHQMQTKYDEETNHSLNKEKQKEWEKFVRSELGSTKWRYDYAQNN